MNGLLVLLTLCFQDGFVINSGVDQKPVVTDGGFVIKSRTKPTPPAKVEKAKAVVYRWRIEHIATPVGYRSFDIDGDDNPGHAKALHHLLTTHGKYIPNEIDISSMSLRDIRVLHSYVHSIEAGYVQSRILGEWQTVCPLDGSGCVQTFVIRIP